MIGASRAAVYIVTLQQWRVPYNTSISITLEGSKLIDPDLIAFQAGERLWIEIGSTGKTV